MEDEGAVLAQFMDITGADDGTAISVLEACNWQLDQVGCCSCLCGCVATEQGYSHFVFTFLVMHT